MDATEKSNASQAFFNFIKSLVGIAILDLPYAANRGGYLLSCLSFVIISYGTIRTTMFLIDIADHIDLHTYSKIVKSIKGKAERTLLDCCIIGYQLFTCIAYLIFFQFTSQRALSHLNIEIGPLFNMLSSLIVILPLSLIRDIHYFHSTSTVGFLLAVFALVSVGVIGFGQIGLNEATPIRFSGFFQFIGVGMLTYEGICTVLPVRLSMMNMKEFNSVFLMCIFSGFLITCSFIAINCLAYGDSIQQIIFFNLPGNQLTFILQFGYAISILLTYPIQIHPALEIIEKKFTNRQSQYQWIIMRLIVMMFLYIIAYMIPNFSSFLNLVGAVLGTLLQYWFPISMRIKYCDLRMRQKIECYGLLSLGATAGCFGIYQTMIDMYNQL